MKRSAAKRGSEKSAPAKTMAGYLAALPKPQRDALQKLRKDIKAAAPELEECISYGVPAFRWKGKFLLAMGAGKNHCSFYPGATVQRYQALVKGYETSKGTIRFQSGKPLPAILVKKLVKARIAEKG